MLTKRLPALAVSMLLSGLTACADDRGSSSDDESSCVFPSDGEPAKDVEPPDGDSETSGQIGATLQTSVGDLGITLDADRAPCTVTSFLSLAEQDYYDDSECHRLGAVPGFSMLQCGDPTGSGSGGPGYNVPDEFSGDETYPAGTVAMANSGVPNSGGGQFFLVFGDTQLQPSFTIFGTLEPAAIKILERVAAAGTDNSENFGVGRPNKAVVFQDVVVD